MGLTCFIIRLSAVIRKRRYGNCFVLLLNIVIELEHALNPLSLSKQKLKQAQRSINLELDNVNNRLYLLENRFHILSHIHNNDNNGNGNMDNGDDDTGSNGNSPTNKPLEASYIFRQKSSFQEKHDNIGKMIRRKMVTFKDDGDSHQGEGTEDGFPPPPAGLDEISECEDTGLLSAGGHGGAKKREVPPSSIRPRLRISRVRGPGFSGTPPPLTPPPPPSPSPSPTATRSRGRKSPAPQPPAVNDDKE